MKTVECIVMIIFYCFSLNILSFETKKARVAVDYLCIDFKYNRKKEIKICEIQLAKKSGGMEGVDAQKKQKGYVARLFFSTLHQHFPRVYMISQSMCRTYQQEAKKSGVHLYGSLKDFFRYAQTQKSFKSRPSNPEYLASYGCILLTSIPDLKIAEDIIRKRFPGILLMDKSFHRAFLQDFNISHDKGKMDQILKHYNALKVLRPKSLVCLTEDYPFLYDTIEEQIGGKFFVIKPLKHSNGQGIIIVGKEKLEETLENIATKKIPEYLVNDKENKKILYNKYLFWKNRQPPRFVVEEFIQSDTFISPIDRKPYDPTFRIFVLLIHSDGHTKAIILGDFLKIPPFSLLDNVSLTAKHCSCSQHRFALPQRDKDKIEQKFTKILPLLHYAIRQKSRFPKKWKKY